MHTNRKYKERMANSIKCREMKEKAAWEWDDDNETKNSKSSPLKLGVKNKCSTNASLVLRLRVEFSVNILMLC